MEEPLRRLHAHPLRESGQLGFCVKASRKSLILRVLDPSRNSGIRHLPAPSSYCGSVELREISSLQKTRTTEFPFLCCADGTFLLILLSFLTDNMPELTRRVSLALNKVGSGKHLFLRDHTDYSIRATCSNDTGGHVETESQSAYLHPPVTVLAISMLVHSGHWAEQKARGIWAICYCTVIPSHWQIQIHRRPVSG